MDAWKDNPTRLKTKIYINYSCICLKTNKIISEIPETNHFQNILFVHRHHRLRKLCRSLHAEALQATVSEGLAQGPYMAVRAALVPMLSLPIRHQAPQ